MFEIKIKAETVESLRTQVAEINDGLNGFAKVTLAETVASVATEFAVTQAPVAPEDEEVVSASTSDDVLDVNGLPYDSRIHSEGRSKNKDGSWRNKRGVDSDFLKAVEAELKGTNVAPVAPAPQPAVSLPPVAPVAFPPFAASVEEPMAPVKNITFQDFMIAFSNALGAGTHTMEGVSARLVELGVDGGMAKINDHPEIMAKVYGELTGGN